MIKIVVTYSDGKYYSCEEVEKVVYNPIAGDAVTVEGDAITGHHFPLGRTLWVHTSSGVCTVSGEHARAVDVFSE